MASTVREFVYQMYRLITASNPTVPLHGDDEELAIRVLNQVLKNYASTGLLLTIAKTVTVPVNLGQKEIWFVDENYPTESVVTDTVTLSIGVEDIVVTNGSQLIVGDVVTGNGIPDGTVVLEIIGNTVTLSEEPTINGPSLLSFTHSIADPTVAYIKEGRLANLDNAWLVLSGVTYPLIDKSRDEFLAAWKYEPLQGLPRFIITYPDTNIVKAQLYPAPSQFYNFFCRGKFQKMSLTSNDTLEGLPEYFELFFLYAVAKFVAKFKGRGSAWTTDLENDYQALKADMEAASEVNLSIAGDEQSLLNGAWRVRSGT